MAIEQKIAQSLILLALLVGGGGCKDPEPQALDFGKDRCDSCRMTFSDRKYGAEIILKKGKVYKFDALECLVPFYRSHLADVRKVFVVDFTRPGSWVDAEKAVFLRVEGMRSPMGEGILAARDTEAFIRQGGLPAGPYLRWQDILAHLEKSR